LEDFLESTAGAPLLGGVEPGSPPLTLIDDLHGQLLSSSGVLDHHPPSPMDTFDLHHHHHHHHPTPPPPPPLPSLFHGGGGRAGEQMVDVMEWLDLTMGTAGGEGLGEDMFPAHLAPLAPPTPISVFSADFLNASDLQMGWESCL